MFKFLNTKFDFFGLDISDVCLRMAKVQNHKKELLLTSFGEKKIEKGIVEEGRIKNEKLLGDNIKELINESKGEKIKTKYVAVSLPEEKSFFQIIEMPKMNEREMEKAVMYEAENYIPLPIEDIYLDFQLISSDKNRKFNEVLITSFPRKIIDSYIYSIERAGFMPVILEIEPIPIIRSIIGRNNPKENFLLIDIRETKTVFIIFSENSIRFTGSIPISSIDFIEKISKHYNISLEAAKKKVMSLEINNHKNDIYDILYPFFEEILNSAQKYLSYYNSRGFASRTKNKNEINKIIIYGEGSNIKNLSQLFLEKTGIKTEQGDFSVNFSEINNKIPKQDIMNYEVALGLAMRNN